MLRRELLRPAQLDDPPVRLKDVVVPWARPIASAFHQLCWHLCLRWLFPIRRNALPVLVSTPLAEELCFGGDGFRPTNG